MAARRNALVLFAFVGGTSACSLLVSVDGLVGDGGIDGNVAAALDGGDGSADAASDSADAAIGDASIDASGDSGALACGDAGVFLCEDFDKPLDAQKWPIQETYLGKLTLDPLRAHRGASSMHFHVDTNPSPPNSSIAHIGHRGALPNEYYIRAFVYQPSPLGPERQIYFNVLQNENGGFSLELHNNAGFVLVESRSPSYSALQSSSSPIPMNQWVCLEWHVKGSTSAGAAPAPMEVFINGSSLPEMQASLPAFPSTVALFGPFSPVAFDMWMDDIIIDVARVGCSK